MWKKRFRDLSAVIIIMRITLVRKKKLKSKRSPRYSVRSTDTKPICVTMCYYISRDVGKETTGPHARRLSESPGHHPRATGTKKPHA